MNHRSLLFASRLDLPRTSVCSQSPSSLRNNVVVNPCVWPGPYLSWDSPRVGIPGPLHRSLLRLTGSSRSQIFQKQQQQSPLLGEPFYALYRASLYEKWQKLQREALLDLGFSGQDNDNVVDAFARVQPGLSTELWYNLYRSPQNEVSFAICRLWCIFSFGDMDRCWVLSYVCRAACIGQRYSEPPRRLTASYLELQRAIAWN